MRPVALAAAVLFACNNGGEQGPGFSSSITTAPPATTSSGGDTSTSTSTSTSSAEDSAAAGSASASSSTSAASSGGFPDVGTPPDGGDGPPPGCKGKIDIMFTIDSSSTMFDQQAALKAAFPGFVATLESEFADFDYHILSTNTFGSWALPWCEGCNDVCAKTPDYPCSAALEPCDSVHGAGVTFPRGDNASNKRCDLASGRRYITAGQPDLEDAFTCIASMGTNGADAVAEVTVKALADDINGPGGCNAEFLRSDALLFVVAIQDTWDNFSEGTAKDWAGALVEAKGGDADAVVLLVISSDTDTADGLCGNNVVGEHKLRTWTELMPHGLFRSACAENFAPFFAEAAAMIKEQCDVFAPQ